MKSESNGPKRMHFPRIDFVTVMVIVVILVFVLFVTSELWLPHWFNE